MHPFHPPPPPMRLYLMRHGIAEDAGPMQSDASRALTARGRARLDAQARAFARLAAPGATALPTAPWACDVLLASPYVRAADTAAYVGRAFGVTPVLDERLASGAGPSDYAAVLAAQPRTASVWVVTHEPDLSRTVEHLTGARVPMRKGTVAVLDVHAAKAGGGVLLGVYDPEVLAALGA